MDTAMKQDREMAEALRGRRSADGDLPSLAER
jgi:hypothetical protein